MAEMTTLRQILLACGRGAVRLFRQNVGQGWVGQSTRFTRAQQITVLPGDVLVRKARPLHAGLCDGSSDLIGWRTVAVVPAMVGQRLAVFTALEVKSERGPVTDEQVRFLDAVHNAGGIAAVVRTVGDAEAALAGDSRSSASWG